MELLEQSDVSPELAWIATFVAGIVTVAGAALAFPRQVYRGYLWRYLWGPVHADAEGVGCFVHFPGSGETVTSSSPMASEGCARVYENAFVAEPGYTVVSTITYIIILVFMLVGVYLLIQQFALDPASDFFFALFPFMLFGGALRNVEDAFVAAQRAGETPAIEFPASALLISPFIYFTVFFIALSSFLFSKWLSHKDITETFRNPLAAIGAGWLALAVGYNISLSVTTGYVDFFPSILVIVIGLATVLAVGTYFAIDTYRPAINAGTGYMGLVVLWGHAIDGVANVLASDWTWFWGLGEYGAKHPFNRFIMDATNAAQATLNGVLVDSGFLDPDSLVEPGKEIVGVYVGDSWPFLIVKILVPVLIIAVFDEEFIEENPRYAVMLLIAIVAVGLGPGTRDMLRVAFGI